MMREHRNTPVVHPTGSGKSFIVFKLAEEHPGEGIVWLAPSKYIFCSRKENYLAAGGDAVGHHLPDLCEADVQDDGF